MLVGDKKFSYFEHLRREHFHIDSNFLERLQETLIIKSKDEQFFGTSVLLITCGLEYPRVTTSYIAGKNIAAFRMSKS